MGKRRPLVLSGKVEEVNDKCQSDGCTALAVVAPKICVPATGYEIGQHKHLQSILGLKLCDDHFQEFVAETDLMSPANEQLRQLFEAMARVYGEHAPPPDFKRAWIGRVSLTSSEFRIFESIRGK